MPNHFTVVKSACLAKRLIPPVALTTLGCDLNTALEHFLSPSNMILRYRDLANLPFLLILCQVVLADDFDCKPTLEGSHYDLTSLGNGEHVVNRTRETPPTQMVDSLAFDICGDLKTKEGLSEHDQVR